MTLSVLSNDLREQLLDDWLAAGGGIASFHASESDAFLEFIAARLPNPSHALSYCRLEQATLRVHEGARDFVPQIPKFPCWLKKGSHASVATFFGEPHKIMAAIEQGICPPLSPNAVHMIFAPGIPNFCRELTANEQALWVTLQVPAHTDALFERHSQALVTDLVSVGALEASETEFGMETL